MKQKKNVGHIGPSTFGSAAIVSMAHDKRLLLLEFGVGFNTPVIIRFPFEQMAARFPDTTLVRFNRDYPQLTTQGISRYVAFSEGMEQIVM